jgi:hypothetical protein
MTQTVQNIVLVTSKSRNTTVTTLQLKKKKKIMMEKYKIEKDNCNRNNKTFPFMIQ